MKTPSKNDLLSIMLILASTIATYGLFIFMLGFYRDDWYLLWTYESLGAQGLIDIFRGDRPFVGWLYILDFKIAGVSPVGWQIYGLFIKVLSVLSFFWLVRSIWPDRKTETTILTILFAIYPGYYQQPNALTFKQLMIAYTAALLSLAFMVNAVKSEKTLLKILFTLLSVALSAYYIMIYEALVGLEVARILILGRMLYQNKYSCLVNARFIIKQAIPYFVFPFLFVIWRVFYFQSTRNATNIDFISGNYTNLHGLVSLFFEFSKDLIEISALAWVVPFYQFASQAIYKDLGLALGVGILISGACCWYVKLTSGYSIDNENNSQTRDWIWLGVAIIFITTIPVVAAGRNALFAVQWDRYTYQSVLGAALLAAGLVFHGLQGKIRWVALFVLILSGVSTQVFSAMYYREFWEHQREAWWQLYWRAPQIQSGTTVIASLPGQYQLAEEYEVWGPINLVYHRGEPIHIPGQLMIDQLVVDLRRGTIEDRLVRGTINVQRDYSKVIIASMASTKSCLRIFDGDLPIASLYDPPNVKLYSLYSNQDFINLDANAPPLPVDILGSEPAHTWCYFYQKINAALQSGEWKTAVQIAEEARRADETPDDQFEWFTVLTAYANAGDEKRAKQVSTYFSDKRLRFYICDQLSDVAKWPDGYRSDIIMKYLCRSAD